MKHKTLNKNNLQNALSKSSPTMCALVEELSKFFDCFLRLSGLPDLFAKQLLIIFKFSLFDFSTRYFQEQIK